MDWITIHVARRAMLMSFMDAIPYRGGTIMKKLHISLLVLFALSLIFGLAGVGLADEAKGKFKEALADKETFVVTQGDQDQTYKLGDKAKILINDRESALTDLKAGDNVTVTWQLQNDRRIASMITCKRD